MGETLWATARDWKAWVHRVELCQELALRDLLNSQCLDSIFCNFIRAALTRAPEYKGAASALLPLAPMFCTLRKVEIKLAYKLQALNIFECE